MSKTLKNYVRIVALGANRRYALSLTL